MSSKQSSLFSIERVALFTGLPEGQLNRFDENCEVNLIQLLSPVESIESQKYLEAVIKKKDAKIRELTKKLKNYEADFSENKNLLENKDYQLRVFKQKIRDELQRSKELEKEVDKANKRLFKLIDSLEIVEKLKNPLQKEEQKIQYSRYQFQAEKQAKQTIKIKRINQKSLRIIEKAIEKVEVVILNAYKITKTKKEKGADGDSDEDRKKHKKNIDYYYKDRA